MSRILVAIDLSAGSDEALRQADAWAKRTNGKLGVIHVMPDLVQTHTLFPQETANAALGAAELEARVKGAVADRIESVTGRTDADRIVDMGVDYARILDHAESWKADLVVCGAHGHTGVRKAIGGVAEKIARYAHCEVLVVRESPEKGPVLAGTDLSDPSMPAVSAAAREAHYRGVPLLVVSAVDTPLAAYFEALGVPFGGAPPVLPDAAPAARAAHLELLQQAIQRTGTKGEAIIADGPAQQQILRIAAEQKAGLIVIATHGRSGLRRIALGSVTERVLETSPISVLVVRFR
jgi:nucleotide-binding universal stress UspA family protein